MGMNYEVIEPNEVKQGTPAVIKVIGAGGGGSNAVNRMMSSDMRYVDFIVANTSLQPEWAAARERAPLPSLRKLQKSRAF